MNSQSGGTESGALDNSSITAGSISWNALTEDEGRELLAILAERKATMEENPR